MTSRRDSEAWNKMMASVLGTGIGIGILLGISFGSEYYLEHKNDEKGTIIKKDNMEIVIDTDGDKNPDRVICFEPSFSVYYNYAQVGDKISYVNKGQAPVLKVGGRANKLRKINGKTPEEIRNWQMLNEHVKTGR